MTAGFLYPHQQVRDPFSQSISPGISHPFHQAGFSNTSARQPKHSEVHQARVDVQDESSAAIRRESQEGNSRSAEVVNLGEVEAALLLIQSNARTTDLAVTPQDIEVKQSAPMSSIQARVPKKRRKNRPSDKVEGRTVLPFIQQLSNILDDVECKAIVSWSRDGKAMLLHDVQQFEQNILPKYFNHSNYWSFTRQISYYGFKKSLRSITKDMSARSTALKSQEARGTETSDDILVATPRANGGGNLKPLPKNAAFQHPSFLRGRSDLLCTIQRSNSRSQDVLGGEGGTGEKSLPSFELWNDRWTPVFGPSTQPLGECIIQEGSTAVYRDVSPFSALYTDEAALFPFVQASSSVGLSQQSNVQEDFEAALSIIEDLKDCMEKLPAGHVGWAEIAKGLRGIAAEIKGKAGESDERPVKTGRPRKKQSQNVVADDVKMPANEKS